MAGNLKNWWKKCKIRPSMFLNSRKVLECQTDSEDLIYSQGRTSSCSAPPDLLIVTDKPPELISNNESTNIKDDISQKIKYNKLKNSTKDSNNDSKDCGKSKQSVPLEEFTCDVSVESSASSLPLQFSFTFYDLDGHHGKITKDDIAGIVYTIYESIGNSVTVPFNGSKTITVKLTVSPENNTITKKQNNGRKSNFKCSTKITEGEFKNNLKQNNASKKNNIEAIPTGIPKRESKLKHKQVRKGRRVKKNESRQRSLSVGNEAAWKLHSKSKCQSYCRNSNNTQYDMNLCNIGGSAGDLENAQHTCNANGLKRNELIDIIRESMEKNKLCFQTNGKRIGSKHRKNENVTMPFTTDKKNLEPHIPIYQQQLAVNPAIFSTHHGLNGERNLCGYDSVLHAKICNGEQNSSAQSMYDENTLSPQLSFHHKLQPANFKEYLDLKAKKNVKNNLLYSKLSEKLKNDINLNKKLRNDNRDVSSYEKCHTKDEQFYNIELENLISSSSSEDEGEEEQTKSNSSNDNNSFSSSMIHRYVHEHIHHHYHHFENQDE